MDQIVQFVDPLKQFAKDSVRLVKRCTKPDKKGKIVCLKLIFFFCDSRDRIILLYFNCLKQFSILKKSVKPIEFYYYLDFKN